MIQSMFQNYYLANGFLESGKIGCILLTLPLFRFLLLPLKKSSSDTSLALISNFGLQNLGLIGFAGTLERPGLPE